MHVHSSGWSTTYTPLHESYNAIRRSRLLHQNVCIQFTPVMHVTARELHSYSQVCEVALISKVYDKYPKSIIISSGSSTGAQKPRKLSIPARIATKLHTGRLAGEGSSADFNQLDLLEGPLFVQTFYTTPRENTKSQLHDTQQLQNRYRYCTQGLCVRCICSH